MQKTIRTRDKKLNGEKEKKAREKCKLLKIFLHRFVKKKRKKEGKQIN